MYVIKVPLGVRSYTISIGSNLLSRLGHECKRLYLGQRCAVITDRNVAPHYGEAAVQSLKASGFDPILITVPAGETAKSLKVAASCYDQLAEHRLERKSFVVALGGGVVGDLGGFVAATYQRDPDTLSSVVARCCQIKAGVVGQDETESGLRAILNFGHTLGHGLETISGYGKLLHGQAIAIGQVFAARLSAELLGFPQRDVERIAALFEKAGLPTHIRLNPVQIGKLLEAMRHDKKVSEEI